MSILLIILKWYLIVSAICLTLFFLIMLYDRIKYGPFPIVNNEEEL
jgi:hypothetical protein